MFRRNDYWVPPSVVVVASWDNLYRAWRQARSGKLDRPAVGRFGQNLERELYDLQHELREGRYRTARYRLFTLCERKPRQRRFATAWCITRYE